MAKNFIRVEDKDVRLSAGMNTSAEIKTDRSGTARRTVHFHQTA